MKRKIMWISMAALPLGLVAAIASSNMNRVPPPPEISLGVMRSCTQIGVIAREMAEDKAAGIELNKERYRHYSEKLARRQPLFNSPGLAVIVAYSSDNLQPETVKNLGVQSCIAAYYGFHQGHYIKTLRDEALACQQDSKSNDHPGALGECMGASYQRTMAQWWQEANRKS